LSQSKIFLEKNSKNIFVLEKVCQSLQAQTEINWFPRCMKVFAKMLFEVRNRTDYLFWHIVL